MIECFVILTMLAVNFCAFLIFRCSFAHDPIVYWDVPSLISRPHAPSHEDRKLPCERVGSGLMIW